MQGKSIDWFLYDRDLQNERVKRTQPCFQIISNLFRINLTKIPCFHLFHLSNSTLRKNYKNKKQDCKMIERM